MSEPLDLLARLASVLWVGSVGVQWGCQQLSHPAELGGVAAGAVYLHARGVRRPVHQHIHPGTVDTSGAVRVFYGRCASVGGARGIPEPALRRAEIQPDLLRLWCVRTHAQVRHKTHPWMHACVTSLSRLSVAAWCMTGPSAAAPAQASWDCSAPGPCGCCCVGKFIFTYI